MLPWFVPIAVGSAAGFQCFNTALDVLPIPPPLEKYAGNDRHRWRNAATSLFNSFLMSCFVLYCLCSHSDVWTNPVYYYTEVADVGFALLAGYLIYDTYDLLAYTNITNVMPIVLHHVIVCSSLFILSIEKLVMGIIYIGLLTEVNAIFLHSRQLLLMYGVSKGSTVFNLHKMFNLVTFILLRIVPLMFTCLCSFTVQSSLPVYLKYILPLYTSALVVINCVLLWRLLCSDFWNKDGKDNHILDG